MVIYNKQVVYQLTKSASIWLFKNTLLSNSLNHVLSDFIGGLLSKGLSLTL
uniref:Uncharacterized protein n=1 Tax=Pseudoalteromonas luteoviolacea TaxID=43657 RepID=A0A023PYV3_9GAMM|nr:hypothetical protein [Pseudoalteromonas luteoviolacea]